ncbi:MAG: hypothetical protein ACYC0V_02760 [Armatimonadota bacterium]
MDLLRAQAKANLIVETSLGDKIAIVAREPHPAFISPVTADEIRDVLLRVPPEFLVGLGTIYLLGGTSKQDTVAFSKLFRYGCYMYNRNIVLFAFPRRCLAEYYDRLPPPDVMQEYTKAGATWENEGKRWVLRFTSDAVRDYYLYDVLLHEIGHHVDRDNLWKTSTADSESYAKWFVEFHGQNLKLK